MMNADNLSDNTTTVNDVGEWEEFQEQLLSDPEVREEYERTFHATVALRKILQTIETEREKAGLSKAELAQRIGVNPASLRRLLTAEGSNPTLRTMLGVFEALDLELSLKPMPSHKRKKRQVSNVSVSSSRNSAA